MICSDASVPADENDPNLVNPWGVAFSSIDGYLSRYTHRVAISNQRLVPLDEAGMTFRYEDYHRPPVHDAAPCQRVHPIIAEHPPL